MKAKSLDTLVKDIYDVFSHPPNTTEGTLREFGESLGQVIHKRITEQREEPSLRFSNIGSPCSRKLWYSINTPHDAIPLPPQARLKYLIGDIWEHVLLFLAKLAGHDVQGEQDELFINGVRGRRDAVIDGVTIDAKSASSFAFDKFKWGLKQEQDDFGYLKQLGAYLYAGRSDDTVRQKDVAGFLVGDKTSGEICLDIHPDTGLDYEALIEEKKIEVSQPYPPGRAFNPIPDQKAGNMKLPTFCSYCDFKYKCWEKDANNGKGLRTFLYSNGPRYLTKVVFEPAVTEIDKDGTTITK